MAGGREDVLRQFHRLFGAGTLGGLTDAELLGRFTARRDERAFEALVERHGPMVLRVCRSVLGAGHDADDAFQATFLVLARKAGSLWVGDSLGRWLFGVARRAAYRARRAAARRSRHERNAAEGIQARCGGFDPDRAEAATFVIEEVERLPGSYRSAVVLCYLEGLTYEEAAGRLGVSEGTVRGRLSRARERLRVRLSRRGVGASALLAFAADSARSTSAAPADLYDAAVRAAMQTLAGKELVAGAVSAAVTGLANGVLREMTMSMLKTAGTVLLVAGCSLAAAKGFLFEPTVSAADPAPPSPVAASEAKVEPASRQPDEPALLTREIPKPWETVVRVKVHGVGSIGFGSGTVIKSTPEESLILTCGHTFVVPGGANSPPNRFRHRVTVDLFDGKLRRQSGGLAHVNYLESVTAEVIDYDFRRDVGLLRIHPGRKLAVSPIVDRSWTASKGMEMVTAGCSEGNDATFWTTEITKSDPVQMFETNKDYEAVECRYAPKQGRTGGGLFTQAGELAGVCNFAEPRGNVGYYAAPKSIYRMLDRNGLSSLYSRGQSLVETPAVRSLEERKLPTDEPDLAFPIIDPPVTPSLADHERRLREVEQRLERLLKEREGL